MRFPRCGIIAVRADFCLPDLASNERDEPHESKSGGAT